MGLYALIGKTPAQRRENCEMKMLESFYSSRYKEAEARLRAARDACAEALNDPDPRDRLYARRNEMRAALLDFQYVKTGQSNLAAISR